MIELYPSLRTAKISMDEFSERMSSLGRKGDVKMVYNLSKKDVEKMIENMEEDTIYVFSNEKMFDVAKKKITEPMLCNIFHRYELEICPMDSDMVPEHELLDEIPDIVSKHPGYRLPRILFSDPVVRWNGWRCNSYIRITRKDGTIYYRHLYCSQECRCI